jgi:hypothetical protein|tara:strand:- start:1011 stop:1187 length:177 start_codon:yes stop_codon:yes gene_type:complete
LKLKKQKKLLKKLKLHTHQLKKLHVYKPLLIKKEPKQMKQLQQPKRKRKNKKKPREKD